MGQLATVEAFERRNAAELIVTPAEAIPEIKQALNGRVVEGSLVVGNVLAQVDENELRQALGSVAVKVEWYPAQTKPSAMVETTAL